MFEVEVPGYKKIRAENVVFDFNGTLAVDGKLSPAVREMLQEAGRRFKVFILSSDTYGTVREECEGLNVSVELIKGGDGSTQKRDFVFRLGAEKTICIGNGSNDIGMFREAALSVIIIGREGCSAKALASADIAVTSTEDALGLLLNPARIKATLRN